MLAEDEEARRLAERCAVSVLRLAALSLLNDQQCCLDWDSLATVVPYARDDHEVLDDSCKKGTLCLVLFPALRTGNTVHAKAAVLAQDYRL